jgi:exosome complex component RRP4
MVVIGEDKELVIPGDHLSDDPSLSGEGTYVEGRKVYSLCYGIVERGKGKIRVVPLSGKYIPARGDVLVGKIIDVDVLGWEVDINSPYKAYLHVTECPYRISPGELSQHLKVGDLILTKIIDVDLSMNVNLTMNEQSLGHIRVGRIIEISPTRVPRLIGRGGSMINLLKRKCGCEIFVGRNGRVWLNGSPEKVELAASAILKIDDEAHTSGLTDRISDFLGEKWKKKLRNS